MMQLRNIMLVFALLATMWLPVGRACSQTTQPAIMPFGINMAEIPVEPSINETSSRTVELLGEAICNAPTAARLADLIHDLGSCQLPEASKYLVPVLSHADAMVRAEAARSLAMVGDRAVTSKLKPLLIDASASVRREAVLAGAKLGDDSFASSGLVDTDAFVIIAGLSASHPSDADSIASRLATWQDDVKVQAIRALVRHAAIQHANVIADCLRGGVQVRCAAVEALGVIRAERFEADVRQLLADKHPVVRREAIRALAQLTSNTQSSALAIRMLADSDISVREAAVRVLIACPAPEATESLLSQLASPNDALHHAARDALVASGKSGIPSIVETSVQLLKDANPRRREDGSYVLGKLRSNAGLTEHLALLKDSDLLLAGQAARSLGDIGNPEAGAALCELIIRTLPEAQSTGENEESSNQASRAACAAIMSCAELRYQPLREIVKPLIGKEVARSTPLRAAAIWAFGVIGTPDDEATCQRLLSFHADAYEANIVKYEAIKALGNLRYAKAASQLRSIEATESFHPLRWIAHQASDRITGTHTPFIPRPVTWTADVGVVDQPHR